MPSNTSEVKVEDLIKAALSSKKTLICHNESMTSLIK